MGGMIGDFARFDMVRRPERQLRILSPIIWAVAYLRGRAHHVKIDASGMPKNVKPPYFLLCNHNSFMDFIVTTKAIFPHHANYVVAIDGFIGIEGLLRSVGGIGTRKFILNISLVKNMLAARRYGDVIVLYPEARYSLCGTQSELPESVGKMIRQMKLPVATLIMHGHHVDYPIWHGSSHGVKPVKADLKLLFTQEEVRALPVAEINAKLAKAFEYDDFAWQKENDIHIDDPQRAEGLHKVLYQCPACQTEYQMSSEGDTLTCGQCGKSWQMDELGELSARNGQTEFSHIPDWYEWERANVRREVEAGTYSFAAPVRIESLPNTKGFVTFKEPGRLVHGMDGFTLTGSYKGEDFTLRWPVAAMYACHIEYNYKGRGDCVDLNTYDDTFYLFPQSEDVAVTKVALATEELHKCRKQVKEVTIPVPE
jgi:1-acyl-sn-glycerol-3-phosphate acyltransferase